MVKRVVSCTWDDVPHLTAEDKADMIMSYPPYQRDARTKGIPQLGSGAIYPVEESAIKVDPFDIPKHWPRGYGMDVGWRFTAALFAAHDRETDIVYLYDEHYREQAEPDVHAAAIKRRGEWLPGVIDPAARGRSPRDGGKLIDDYNDLGLHLNFAENAVEAGLFECYQRMTTSRLRVFSHLSNYWREYRLYRRDKHGKVVKEMDHLMDCQRYIINSGIPLFLVAPNFLGALAGKAHVVGEYDPHSD